MSKADTVFERLLREAKKAHKSWVQPKSGDLLGDAKYFLEQAKAARELRIRARHGRAALVISVAAIEAITNDGLATIHQLLGESWPSEVVRLPPCCYFKRTSYKRVERLLRRGKLRDKIEYLRRHINRITYVTPSDDLWSRLGQVVQARNRVIHMTYLWNPNKYPSVLRARQVAHTAAVAYDTASEYINFLREGFEEINLPIETIRTDWWSEEQLT